jgi:hypothetical protein
LNFCTKVTQLPLLWQITIYREFSIFLKPVLSHLNDIKHYKIEITLFVRLTTAVYIVIQNI